MAKFLSHWLIEAELRGPNHSVYLVSTESLVREFRICSSPRENVTVPPGGKVVYRTGPEQPVKPLVYKDQWGDEREEYHANDKRINFPVVYIRSAARSCKPLKRRR